MSKSMPITKRFQSRALAKLMRAIATSLVTVADMLERGVDENDAEFTSIDRSMAAIREVTRGMESLVEKHKANAPDIDLETLDAEIDKMVDTMQAAEETHQDHEGSSEPEASSNNA